MKKVSHKKAPVSEVIFGLTYNYRKFDDNTIFKFQQKIENEYPEIQYLNPLHDEKLNEDRNITEIEILPHSTGNLLFRFRNLENTKLIQIQGNKIYFNWIRQDNKPTGEYPGFDENFEIFYELLELLNSIENIDSLSDVKYFELTYHDRMVWSDYISDLNNINNILNIEKPMLLPNNESLFVISNKQISKTHKTKGFSVLSINSSNSITTDAKLLGIEYSIRGKFDNLKSWFSEARASQNEMFNKLINEKILKSWE